MVPFMVLSRPLGADTNVVASHDSNTNANDITQQKNDAAPYFNCLNLRKAVVLLMMLLAWCDTDASANGIK